MRYLPAITIRKRYGWNMLVVSGMRWALEIICSLWNCAGWLLLAFRWLDDYNGEDWEYRLADWCGWLEQKGVKITFVDKLGDTYIYAMEFDDKQGNHIKLEMFWYLDRYMEEMGMREIPLLEVEVNGRRLMYVRFVSRKKKQDVDSLLRQLGYIWGMTGGKVDLGEGWIRGYRKKNAISRMQRKSWAVWLMEKKQIQEKKIETIMDEQRKAKERARMVEDARSSIEDIQLDDDSVLRKMEETAEKLDNFEYVVEECRRRGLKRLAEKIERAKLIDESQSFVKREKKLKMMPDGLLVEEETGEESLAYIKEDVIDEKIDDTLRRKLDAVWPKKKAKKKMAKKMAGRKLKKVTARILEDGSFVLVEEDA
ncbi:MAG: hypothetical protein KatS3mg083_613 [Candidatus Dojkabacteria bacterium]|nr:MAG: hypothetical protein KatS3mg083_613 [Candidatus Dojkabacteria bacterium]